MNKSNSNFDKGESKSRENFDYKIMATNPQEKYPELKKNNHVSNPQDCCYKQLQRPFSQNLIAPILLQKSTGNLED